MIFITLGNQNFQFNRLLDKIEDLILIGVLKGKVVAQIGHTSFNSDLIQTIQFLTKEEFQRYIDESDFVISHAGTGSIISCIKRNKKVVVVPRLQKYQEHIDNHQLEILSAFENKKLIIAVDKELSDFQDKILSVKTIDVNKFVSNNISFNKNLIEIIEE